MARKKFGLEFEGMEEMIKKLDELGGSLEKAAESALKGTFGLVTPGIRSAMNSSPYNFDHTGQTKGSLKESAQIEVDGTIYKVSVGFDISNGGLPSIFLMHGTPKIAPDRNLYNSVFGTKILNEVKKQQGESFRKHLERVAKK